MGANTVTVTDASFEADVLQSDKLVLVDFWATWCGPCLIVAPVLDQLAGEYAGRAKVAKVDVDANQRTAMRFNVRSIPSILFFKDQDIAVIGGGDTAMEEATFLSRFAKSVTVVHRRDTLRASKAMQERAFADPKISFVWDSEVAEIQGDPKLSGLKLRNLKTGELSDLAVTGLFIAIGHDPRTELFKGQLDLDEEGYLKVDAPPTRTNVTGVFAAGDVVDHTYRQAITAAGTGCSAALDAERYLAALADEEQAEPEKTSV